MEKNKVLVEITEEGYEIKLILNGKEYIERHERTSFGSRGIEGNFDNEVELSEDLLEALTCMDCYEVMKELKYV